ncbi:hypothetical protein CARUB_v10002077mg [Capsella rubella]|uniref:Ferredoxin thioredoxin reductase alpha chain domain-containing protein n=1 Tax=Capsella rubella TaxID=81985 RepID=R0FH45_9BRAS|nr:ferredoxin-thioredoxin reductase, variable chain, chloroplastic [Capsella rubella]EOA21657.1 hypothetical protein CARUB_v10002077mg [Capsella rubella]
MSNTMALSPAIVAAVRPPYSHDGLSSSAATSTTTTPMALKSCVVAPLSLFTSKSRIKRSSSRTASRITIRCDVATKSAESVSPSSSPSSEEDKIEAEAKAKIGSRVRVTAPLKVYHVNRVPEVDLEGMEGKLKDYVSVWKGKRISANLPYKVEFFKEIEGRGPVKFVAHLKDDEFEFIDQ